MKKTILVLVVASLSLTSCVSKKKYNTLLGKKKYADKTINSLNKSQKTLSVKLENTIKEYNDIRNKLVYSNSKKDSKIDSLSQVLKNTRQNINSIKSDIEDKNRTLNDVANSKTNTINRLKAVIKNLKKDKKQLQETYTQYKISSRMKFDKNESKLILTKDELSAKELEISKLNSKIKTLTNKLNKLEKNKKQNKETIERLSNQVKLLKKSL